MRVRVLAVLALVCLTSSALAAGEKKKDGANVKAEPDEKKIKQRAAESLELDDEIDDSQETVPDTSADEPYLAPEAPNTRNTYIFDHFNDVDDLSETAWVKSMAKKEGISEDIAKYDGEWSVERPIKRISDFDTGLVLKSKAKHAAIAKSLRRPFIFDTKPLMLQYTVTFQEGQECGGAYIKLLSEGVDTKILSQFHDKTPYTIMFGPDKCGTDHKLHFIFRHRNPKNGTVEEKHCKKPKDRLEEIFTDKLPHLFTLIVNPDNTYEVQVDRKVVNTGSLFEDFTPSVNPQAEIDDPNDRKPEDWDEREKIPDPDATKPEDWDEDAPSLIVDENAVMPEGWLENEQTHIPDPKAVKPEDWDSDIDGSWEPPLIDNPVCAEAVGCGKWEPPLLKNPDFKGKWKAPLIDNPNYKGKWRPKKIPNPDFYEDKNPFRMQTISAVGFELWSMSENIFFDNLIITDSAETLEKWTQQGYDAIRSALRVDSESVFEKLANLTNQYPALWALYIILLSIPVILILYCCCKPSSPSTREEKDERAQGDAKKTDEFTADDDVVREAEEPEEAAEEEVDKEKYSGDDGDEDEEYKQLPKKEEGAPRKRKPRKE